MHSLPVENVRDMRLTIQSQNRIIERLEAEIARLRKVYEAADRYEREWVLWISESPDTRERKGMPVSAMSELLAAVREARDAE